MNMNAAAAPDVIKCIYPTNNNKKKQTPEKKPQSDKKNSFSPLIAFYSSSLVLNIVIIIIINITAYVHIEFYDIVLMKRAEKVLIKLKIN